MVEILVYGIVVMFVGGIDFDVDVEFVFELNVDVV